MDHPHRLMTACLARSIELLFFGVNLLIRLDLLLSLFLLLAAHSLSFGKLITRSSISLLVSLETDKLLYATDMLRTVSVDTITFGQK